MSTGIHDGLTFGSGNLDFNGFWEHPCEPCARDHEKLYPEDGECWPFGPPTRNELIRASNFIMEDAQDGLINFLKLLNSLTNTLQDLYRDPDDSQFGHINHIRDKISDTINNTMKLLDEIDIPKE